MNMQKKWKGSKDSKEWNREGRTTLNQKSRLEDLGDVAISSLLCLIPVFLLVRYHVSHFYYISLSILRKK